MKSIKEKVEEYSSGYMNLDRQQVAKQAFGSGANYVLGEIDEFIEDSPHVSYTSYKAIKELIEQLKK